MKIRKTSISVTKKCNFRCKHCNIWKFYAEHPELEKLELTEEEIIKILNNSKSLRWVSLTGGEPFLKDMKKILENRPKRIKIFSINTNGWFTEKICDAFSSARGKYILVISLDGPKEIHDKIRGVPGAYERALKTFICVRDNLKGVTPMFEYTITPWNTGTIDRLLDDLEEYGITIHNFAFSVYTSNHYYNHSKKVDVEYRKFLEEVERVRSLVGHMHRNSFVVYPFLSLVDRYYTKRERHPCLAARKSLWVDQDGTVRPCIYLPVKIANIREYDYDLDAVPVDENVVKKVDECPGCWTPCEANTTMFFRPGVWMKGFFDM